MNEISTGHVKELLFVLHYLKKGSFLGGWYTSRAKHWSWMNFILRALSLSSNLVWQVGLLC